MWHLRHYSWDCGSISYFCHWICCPAKFLSLSLHPCVYMCMRLCIFLSFGTISFFFFWIRTVSLFVMAKMVDCWLAAQPKWGLRSAGYAKLTSPMMLCQFHNDHSMRGWFTRVGNIFREIILLLSKDSQNGKTGAGMEKIGRNSKKFLAGNFRFRNDGLITIPEFLGGLAMIKWNHLLSWAPDHFRILF